MDLSGIRTRIVQGNLAQAFGDLDVIAPVDKRNEVQLLWAQYNEWHRQDLLVGGAKPEERNRILYGTLAIISELEERGATGVAAHRARALRDVELDLAQGYARLAQIRKKNVIDLFLMWMIEHHQPVLAEIMRQEDAFGRSPHLPMLLQRVDLAQFIRKNKLNSRPEDALQYLLAKNGETQHFFSGWFEYRDRQEKFEHAYEFEIERCEKRHGRLLKAGLIGGIMGALGVEVFSRNMDNIAAHQDQGLEPPQVFDSSDDDDDAGDDD
ncbi:MAG: hypothetical protein IPM98_00655 [Lewinellaceae bacterium]|nr:hypothetical protein [Lewinellaceae bacterium]